MNIFSHFYSCHIHITSDIRLVQGIQCLIVITDAPSSFGTEASVVKWLITSGAWHHTVACPSHLLAHAIICLVCDLIHPRVTSHSWPSPGRPTLHAMGLPLWAPCMSYGWLCTPNAGVLVVIIHRSPKGSLSLELRQQPKGMLIWHGSAPSITCSRKSPALGMSPRFCSMII